MGRKVVHGGETRNRIGADTRAKKHSRYMKRETRGETRGTGQHRRGALPNSPSKKNACGTHFFSFPSFLHSFPFFFLLYFICFQSIPSLYFTHSLHSCEALLVPRLPSANPFASYRIHSHSVTAHTHTNTHKQSQSLNLLIRA